MGSRTWKIPGSGRRRSRSSWAGGTLATETRLSELNGGDGVDRGQFDITDASGATATIDLSTALNLTDVIDAINGASGVSVTAEADGDRLVITDNSGGGGTFSITDKLGSTTAADLGIAGTGVGGTITGADIRTVSGSTALSLLNDGNGVNFRDGGTTVSTSTDLIITTHSGGVLNIDLGEITETTEDPETGEDVTTVVQNRAATLQDVIDIINAEADAEALDVTASINADGTGLQITDNTAGVGDLIIESGNNRTTAEDLGIATTGESGATLVGQRLISTLNSTLVSRLNGGAGVAGTTLTVTDRTGATHTVDVSAYANESLTGLISHINTDLSDNGVGVTVALNTAGNGLSLTDSSGGTGGPDRLGRRRERAGHRDERRRGEHVPGRVAPAAVRLTGDAPRRPERRAGRGHGDVSHHGRVGRHVGDRAERQHPNRRRPDPADQLAPDRSERADQRQGGRDRDRGHLGRGGGAADRGRDRHRGTGI